MNKNDKILWVLQQIDASMKQGNTATFPSDILAFIKEALEAYWDDGGEDLSGKVISVSRDQFLYKQLAGDEPA